MPLASETYKNKIVQYIGETDDTYTQGYFYKCIMKEDKNDKGYIRKNSC